MSGPVLALPSKPEAIFTSWTRAPTAPATLGVFGVERVEAVLITHAHSDHIDGLGELGVLRWARGNHSTPLLVFGPPVVADVVAGFNLAYAADAGYRVSHHGETVVPASGGGLRAAPFSLPRDGELVTVLETDDGVRISAFQVSHPPVTQAIGYRIDYRDRSVVLSGDTAKSANLINHARGVDLLLHEALASRMTERIAQAADSVNVAGPAKIMRDVPSYHATPVEAAESAAEAGAAQLLLYHIIPPLPISALEQVFLDGVADAYDGPVTLGTDGSLISLPAS